MECNQLKKMMQLLRLRVTVNFFKKCVLKDMNIVGKPQAPNVFDKLGINEEILTRRGWEKWFDGTNKKISKISGKLLDKLADEEIVISNEDGSEAGKLPEHFFKELGRGGLVAKLLAPENSKNVKKLLSDRAQEYKPISFLHLHLDAIEINTVIKDFHGVPWDEILEIASRRVLELLYKDWGPRYGQSYSNLSSSLKLKWGEADENERKKIREFYSRFRPDLFEEKMQPGAEPDWGLIGVSDDIAPQHIYKALFAMASDTDFLIKDRLKEWTFSLATAALAMHALAWSDRYTVLGVSVTEEMVFWGAFETLLFRSDVIDEDCKHIRSAMLRCQAEWNEKTFDVFTDARKIYRKELVNLGITYQDVIDIVKMGEGEHPLVYRG